MSYSFVGGHNNKAGRPLSIIFLDIHQRLSVGMSGESACAFIPAVTKVTYNGANAAGMGRLFGRRGMERKQKILIVDDDAGLSRLVGLILTRAGYEVHHAQTGAEGLAKVAEARPDLILLDVMMPLLDGHEVCRRIRANPATSMLPIIMLSALEQVEDKVKGLESGADDYVAKPVDPKELVLRVRSLLHRASFNQPPPSRTVAVFGAKGGVGATSVALNVAVMIARAGHSVSLVEMRTSGATLRYQLRLRGLHHLGELLALEPDQIRRPEVERRLLRHTSGLHVLLGPPYASERPLTAAHVERVLDVLTPISEHVILDLDSLLVGEGPRRALDLAEQNLLVTEPEMLAVQCAALQVQRLKDWAIFDRTNLVIMTRSAAASHMNRVEVENRLGMGGGEPQAASRWEPRALEVDIRVRQGVAAVIPAAPELFQHAVREGVPITLIEPSNPAARALHDLADWVMGRYLSPEDSLARYGA
jgi:DNA-binding response OmpR family regulator